MKQRRHSPEQVVRKLREADRMLAQSIATHIFGVMSVTNQLKTPTEIREALERS